MAIAARLTRCVFGDTGLSGCGPEKLGRHANLKFLLMSCARA